MINYKILRARRCQSFYDETKLSRDPPVISHRTVDEIAQGSEINIRTHTIANKHNDNRKGTIYQSFVSVCFFLSAAAIYIYIYASKRN